MKPTNHNQRKAQRHMKLKRICFAPSTMTSQRSLSALGGNNTACWVGQRILHNQWRDENELMHPQHATIVSSIELDERLPLVYIRQVYEDSGKPYRRQTNNEKAQPGEEADGIAVMYDANCVLYFDDERGEAPQIQLDEPVKRGPGRPRKNPEAEPAGE